MDRVRRSRADSQSIERKCQEVLQRSQSLVKKLPFGIKLAIKSRENSLSVEREGSVSGFSSKTSSIERSNSIEKQIGYASSMKRISLPVSSSTLRPDKAKALPTIIDETEFVRRKPNEFNLNRSRFRDAPRPTSRLKTEGRLTFVKSLNASPSTSFVSGSPPKSTGFPMKADAALKKYRTFLSSFEIDEIASYSMIYYVSLNADQTMLKNMHARGFDDNHGNYKAVMGEHIAFRYELVSLLGKGSFGRVYKAIDHKSNLQVALKIIKSGRNYRKAGTSEAQILKLIRDKDQSDRHHLVQIQKCLIFRKHVCIVCELLSISLGEFIKQNYYHGSSLNLIRRFAVQILQALRLLYRLRIVHCDLKPDNILLRHPTKSALKVVDLGSGGQDEGNINTYIQSRFYRAPDVVLGLPVTVKIDMWSFGCVLAELFMGTPLFVSENEQELILYIVELRGPPPLRLLKKATRMKEFFDCEGKAIGVPNSRGISRKNSTRTLEEYLNCPDAKFVDLISKCLEWDPAKRFNPIEALAHEWITEGNTEVERKQSPPVTSASRMGHHRRTSSNLEKFNVPLGPISCRQSKKFEFDTD